MDQHMETGQEMSQEQAVEFLRAYLADTGKTQTAVAQELGISSGALSSFLSGSYKTPHMIIPKVRSLAEVSERKKVALEDPPYVETSVSRMVTNAIKYSHIRGKMSMVYGDAGVGKTQAFRHYLEENPLAIGITASPTFASITGVNELLAQELGIRERVARKITAELIARLKDSGRVILIDEAQHLTLKAIEHIRCTAESAKIGVCLIGNEAVYTKIKRDPNLSQLYNRIGIPQPVSTNDITKEDVKKVFGGTGLEGDALDLLYRICHTTYAMRGAVNVYVNTAAVFGGEKVNAQTLARMTKEMNIGR